MGRYKISVLLVILSISHALTLYYACPPTSVCVPLKNCESENVTFNYLTDKSQNHEYQFVCGILAECEGNICCDDPIDLPSNFEPNKTHWCYTEEPMEKTMKMDVHVCPYPGLEEPQSNENSPEKVLCPAGSICVHGSMCLPQFITYYYTFSQDKFTCGNHSGSIGNVCCSISGVFETPIKVPEIKLQFMKTKDDAGDKRESQWSFMDSDYFAQNEVEVKKQKLYKGMSGRSAKAQEWFCGRTLSIANELNRIYAPVGDREAKEGDYPWHVAILSSSYEYLCSGAIIGEKTVVTIAHCFDKHKTAGDILVRVGDLNLQLDTEKNPAFDVKVKQLVIHPNYDKINLDADIAIVEIEESVRSLPHVKPVCLPNKGFSPVINQCKVPGWGQFSKSKEEKNEFHYALRAALFYIIDNTQCQNSLRKVKELGAFFRLQKRVLCAKGYSNADTCRGDGGSGLVCRDKDVYVLKGLVSYGFGCGLDLPGVYTDVEKYLDFINNYKKFISTSSGIVSSQDFGSTYVEQNKLYFPEEQKYTSGVESEDMAPTSNVQKGKIDQSENNYDFQSSSDQSYVDKSPEIVYSDKQFAGIPDPRDEYTYIKPQEPGYVEKPEFNSFYIPEEKVEVYSQSSTQNHKDNSKYEENYLPDSSYLFGNPSDSKYDTSVYVFDNPSDKKPEELQYSNDERLENSYEQSYNGESFSDFGHDSKLSYRPDYVGPNEDKLSYQPDYVGPNEDKLSYQPDYTGLNEDTLSYQPDYIQPDYIPLSEPDYTGSNTDRHIYQSDYIGSNEDTLFYQPDYRRHDDRLSDQDYIEPNFNYGPENDFEEYGIKFPKESYKDTSGVTNNFNPSHEDRLYREDFDHLRYGRGLKRSSPNLPKNVDVKAYSKPSGKASGRLGKVLNGFASSYEPPVKGKVVSPLALLKKRPNKF